MRVEALRMFDLGIAALAGDGTYTDRVAKLGMPEPQWELPPPNTPCLLYTSPSPRDRQKSRMPSSA